MHVILPCYSTHSQRVMAIFYVLWLMIGYVIKLSTVPDIVLELVHVELVLALPAGFSVLFANSLHLLLNQLIILHPIP